MGKAGNTIQVLVGIVLALVGAILLTWAFVNIIFNIPNSFIIILFVSLVIFFLTLGLGALIYRKHDLAGTFLMAFGTIVLFFVIFFYLPIYYDGYWFNLSEWFFWS